MENINSIKPFDFPKSDYANFLYYFHDFECKNIQIVYCIIGQSRQTITIHPNKRKRSDESDEEEDPKFQKTENEIDKEEEEELKVTKTEEEIKEAQREEIALNFTDLLTIDVIARRTGVSRERIEELLRNRQSK